MLDLRAVSPDERAVLYEMAQAYWQELMPATPVVQDPALRSHYFDNPAGQRWGYIRDFYIAPPWRRRGHGRACVQRVTEWLKVEGASGVDLHCRTDNPAALAFWQAVGFEIVSYRLRQYMG